MTHDTIKNAADIAAGTVTLATIVGWLPSIAAGLTVVYTVTRLIIEWPKLKAAVIKWFH